MQPFHFVGESTACAWPAGHFFHSHRSASTRLALLGCAESPCVMRQAHSSHFASLTSHPSPSHAAVYDRTDNKKAVPFIPYPPQPVYKCPECELCRLPRLFFEGWEQSAGLDGRPMDGPPSQADGFSKLTQHAQKHAAMSFPLRRGLQPCQGHLCCEGGHGRGPPGGPEPPCAQLHLWVP